MDDATRDELDRAKRVALLRNNRARLGQKLLRSLAPLCSSAVSLGFVNVDESLREIDEVLQLGEGWAYRSRRLSKTEAKALLSKLPVAARSPMHVLLMTKLRELGSIEVGNGDTSLLADLAGFDGDGVVARTEADGDTATVMVDVEESGSLGHRYEVALWGSSTLANILDAP